jgi:hypothetical protein
VPAEWLPSGVAPSTARPVDRRSHP